MNSLRGKREDGTEVLIWHEDLGNRSRIVAEGDPQISSVEVTVKFLSWEKRLVIDKAVMAALADVLPDSIEVEQAGEWRKL